MTEQIKETEETRNDARQEEFSAKESLPSFAYEANPSPIKKVIKLDNGLELGIEVDPGDYRFIGTQWERPWNSASYGHIRNFVCPTDKMALDIYYGGNSKSPEIYEAIQLKKNDDGSFEVDEVKIFAGFNSIEDAKQAYLDNMPSELFGGIRRIDLNYIQNFKKQPKLLSDIGLESFDLAELEKDPNFKWCYVPITPLENGTYVLHSLQGKDWSLESVQVAANKANERVSQGVQIPVYESHPILLQNPLTGGEEPSSTSNPILAEQKIAIVDLEKLKVFFGIRFLDTPRAQDYKQALDLGYEPDISIRAPINCPDAPKGQQKGLCNIPDGGWLTFDILKPNEYPGIPGSKLTQAMESLSREKGSPTSLLPSRTSESGATLSDASQMPVLKYTCACGCIDKESCKGSQVGTETHLNQQDLEYAKNMIPHHQVAVNESKKEIENGVNPEIKDFAKKVESTQSTEIEFLSKWVKTNESNDDLLNNDIKTQNTENKTVNKRIGVESIMDENTIQMLCEQGMALGQSLEAFLEFLQSKGGMEADLGKGAMIYAKGKKASPATEATPVAATTPAAKPEDKPMDKPEDKPMDMGMMALPGFESLAALPVDQRRQVADHLVSEVTQKNNIQILERSITNARNAKANWPLPQDKATFGFESAVDVYDTAKYPVVAVSKKILDIVSKGRDLKSTASLLETSFSQIATESIAKTEVKEENAKEEKPAQVGTESAASSSIENPIVPKKVENKMGLESSGAQVTSQDVRYRDSVIRLAKTIMGSSKLPKTLIERNQHASKYAMEQLFNVVENGTLGNQSTRWDIDRLNRIHDLNSKHRGGSRFGYESLQVQGLGTDYLNREYIATVIRLISFWSSAVWDLVSNSIPDQMRLGNSINLNNIPFAQFIDIKSRTYNQRDVYDPQYRQLPNQPVHTVVSSDRWDSYPAYYFSSATYTSNELEMFLKAAPLFENVPSDKLLILGQEDALNYTQQIGMEIMLSWMRHATHTVLDEIVADNSNVRNVSTTGTASLHGVTGKTNVAALILPLKAETVAANATMGPLCYPEIVATNTKGIQTLPLSHPVIVKLNGTTLKMGKFNLQNEIVPLSTLSIHANPQAAVHPSGLIGLATASGVVAADFTSGYVELDQYTYTNNFVALDFSNPNDLPTREYANQIVEKVQAAVDQVATKDYAPRPDKVWLPNNLISYIAYAEYLNGAPITNVSYAGVSNGFDQAKMGSGVYFRDQQYVPSNDPVVSNYLGAATLAGYTTAMEMAPPTFKTDIPITVSDSNGEQQLTSQTGAIMQSCRFVNTICTVDSNGKFVNHSPVGLYITNPPSTIASTFRT